MLQLAAVVEFQKAEKPKQIALQFGKEGDMREDEGIHNKKNPKYYVNTYYTKKTQIYLKSSRLAVSPLLQVFLFNCSIIVKLVIHNDKINFVK